MSVFSNVERECVGKDCLAHSSCLSHCLNIPKGAGFKQTSCPASGEICSASVTSRFRLADAYLSRLLIWAILLFSTICVGRAASFPHAHQAPAFLISNFPFGSAQVGQKLNHEFVWRNNTTNPIVVLEVTTSCDCIQVTSFPRVIPIGGEEKLAVRFSAKAPGLTDWTVSVQVEGDSTPRLFCLSGRIEGDTSRTSLSGLLVNPAKLLQEDSPSSKVVFADVRSPDQFRLAHVPGALNLPLFTIKARHFLRQKHLVLLNEGHDPTSLLEEAQRLQQLQFSSVAVLEGGLRAWQLAGGSLEGADTNSTSLALISPAQLYAARHEPGWLVLSLPNAAAMFAAQPPRFRSTLRTNPAQLAADLETFIRPHPEARRLLLITPDGEDYEAVNSLTQTFRALPVFCLAGGAEGYAAHWGQQLAMQSRRVMTLSNQDSTRTRSSGSSRPAGYAGGCGSCGRK